MPTADKHVLLAIYDSLPDPVIILDEADSILSVNSAAVSAFGYAREEMIGRSREILLATAEIEAEDGITCSAARTTASSPAVRRAVWSKRMMRRRSGGSTSSMISAMSPTCRRAARGRANLRDALDAIHEGIAIFDAKERLILFNKTYRTLYGSNAQRLSLGMSMDEVAELAIARSIPPRAPSARRTRAIGSSA